MKNILFRQMIYALSKYFLTKTFFRVDTISKNDLMFHLVSFKDIFIPIVYDANKILTDKIIFPSKYGSDI